MSSAEREELRAARLRIRALETELAVQRRATELLRESVPPKRRVAAISVTGPQPGDLVRVAGEQDRERTAEWLRVRRCRER